MNPDPKFGWHTIWLTPLMFAWLTCRFVYHKITQYYHWWRIQYILFRNPELKRMMKNAGITK